EPRRELHAGRVHHRHLRRELELARSRLVPAQLPPRRGAGALPPLLRRRTAGGAADGVGPTRQPAGGGARDPASPGEPLPPRRHRTTALSRRRAPLHRRPALPRPGAVLRVLPRRDRPWMRRQSSDRMDVAGGGVYRRPRPGERRVTFMRATGPNAEQITFWNEHAGPKWVALQDVLDQQIGPLGREAMDR